MKIMKFLFVFLLTIALAGCSGEQKKNTAPTTSVADKQPVKKKAKPKPKTPRLPAFNTLAKSKKNTKYVVDVVSGQTVNKVKQPIVIKDKNFTIGGWAVDIHQKDTAGGVYVLIDGKPFAAIYGKSRPGVPKALNNPKMLKCGYSLSIPVTKIGKGKHDVSIHVLSKDKKEVYSPDEKRNIKILVK